MQFTKLRGTGAGGAGGGVEGEVRAGQVVLEAWELLTSCRRGPDAMIGRVYLWSGAVGVLGKPEVETSVWSVKERTLDDEERRDEYHSALARSTKLNKERRNILVS